MPVRPHLEAKNILFHGYASNPTKAGVPQRLSFVDVRKAYFNGKQKRSLFMSFPGELGLPPNLVGRQVCCVYGACDSGAIWEDCYRDCLEDMGFTSGISSPCRFFHKEHELAFGVHGNDFTCLGSDANLDWYEALMAKSFELKIKGRLGVGCEGPDEIKILQNCQGRQQGFVL